MEGGDAVGRGTQTSKKRHFFLFVCFFSQGTGTTHCSAPHTQDLRKVFPDATFFFFFFLKLINLNLENTYQQQETQETTECVNTSQADISLRCTWKQNHEVPIFLRVNYIFICTHSVIQRLKKNKFNCQSNSKNNLASIMSHWKAGCRKSPYFLTK